MLTPILQNLPNQHQSEEKLRGIIAERERIEEQLKASLREVADLKAALNEHAIVAMTDPQGKITYVNDKFCEISKYSRQELLGQDHRIINSGYHSKEFIRELWTTITHGKVWHGEIKNRAKDGSYYWVDATIVPFLNEDGKPRQYVAIRADITERKQAEEEIRNLNAGLEQTLHELQEERSRLRHLLEHSPAVIYTLRIEGETVTPVVVSENIERLLGVSVAESTSYEWWRGSLHPKDHDRVLEVLRKSLTQGGYSMDTAFGIKMAATTGSKTITGSSATKPVSPWNP